jgi:hypothetical protein
VTRFSSRCRAQQVVHAADCSVPHATIAALTPRNQLL